MSFIEFKDVSISYDKRNMVINHISFVVDKGKKVAFIGKNGSGKSTIAKAILGLIFANEGQILVDDLIVNSKNLSAIRNKIGIVFQNPDNQFVGNTVGEDVAFRLENNCVPQKEMIMKVNDVLIDVDMLDYINHSPAALSGGQKQRVAIATNIIENLECIIFDESTSMLDPKGKKDFYKLLQKIRKNNDDLIIIYITHSLEEIETFDEVLLLDKGEIKYFGTPKNLFFNKELLLQYHLEEPVNYKIYSLLKSMNYEVDESMIQNVEEMLCLLK